MDLVLLDMKGSRFLQVHEIHSVMSATPSSLHNIHFSLHCGQYAMLTLPGKQATGWGIPGAGTKSLRNTGLVYPTVQKNNLAIRRMACHRQGGSSQKEAQGRNRSRRWPP